MIGTSIAAAVGSQAAVSLTKALLEWLRKGGAGKMNREMKGSMVEFTNVTRNEFLTVVEDSLVAQPYMSSLQQSILSMVSGYYLSSVSLMVDIPGINVVGTLDKLNNNRSKLDAMFQGVGSLAGMVGTESRDNANEVETFLGLESFQYGLMSPTAAFEDQYLQGFGNRLIPAMEKVAGESLDDARLQTEFARADASRTQADLNRERTKSERENRYNNEQRQRNDNRRTAEDSKTQAMRRKELQSRLDAEPGEGEYSNVGYGKGTIDTLKENTNLAVGKVLDVTFESKGNRVQIPVTILLSTVTTDSESIGSILTFGNSNKYSFKERLYKARAGQLRYFKDLILCHDLRKEARRARIRDKSGYIDYMMRQQAKGTAASLLSGAPTINQASSVLVCSAETARSIELEIGGPLSKFKTREEVFQNTALMIIAVVDNRWNLVRFYHRSLETYTEVSVNELKRAAGGNGSNIEDILLAYNAGSAPSI